MDKMQLYSSFQLARMYSHKIDDLIDDGDFFADYITIKEISQCLSNGYEDSLKSRFSYIFNPIQW